MKDTITLLGGNSVDPRGLIMIATLEDMEI